VAARNLFFISTCRVPWRNPRMRDFPGCIESGNNFLTGYIFGPSMGGRFRMDGTCLRKCIPHCGARCIRAKREIPISKMPSLSQHGCGTPTAMAPLGNSCIMLCSQRSENKLRLKVGFSVLDDSHTRTPQHSTATNSVHEGNAYSQRGRTWLASAAFSAGGAVPIQLVTRRTL
jgi:hypothetical protein